MRSQSALSPTWPSNVTSCGESGPGISGAGAGRSFAVGAHRRLGREQTPQPFLRLGGLPRGQQQRPRGRAERARGVGPQHRVVQQHQHAGRGLFAGQAGQQPQVGRAHRVDRLRAVENPRGGKIGRRLVRSVAQHQGGAGPHVGVVVGQPRPQRRPQRRIQVRVLHQPVLGQLEREQPAAAQWALQHGGQDRGPLGPGRGPVVSPLDPFQSLDQPLVGLPHGHLAPRKAVDQFALPLHG